MFVRKARTQSEDELIPKVLKYKLPSQLKVGDELYGMRDNISVLRGLYQDNEETWNLETEHGTLPWYYNTPVRVIEPVVGILALGL